VVEDLFEEIFRRELKTWQSLVHGGGVFGSGGRGAGARPRRSGRWAVGQQRRLTSQRHATPLTPSRTMLTNWLRADKQVFLPAV
jgi:hypothetical protein